MQITFKNVGYVYHKDSPMAFRALKDIDLNISKGKFIAIIGSTGSGKSTIIQHLNGLLFPTEGTVTVGDHYIQSNEKNKNLKTLRQKVGVVFQFPEQQLFEETIEKDICFGPINFGVSKEEAESLAAYWIEKVGLGIHFLKTSPFECSGGQMRRAAIAGILAMEPEILVLDEPTAGLDPKGSQEMMNMFSEIHKERDITTILVTHSMEDAVKYADEIVVMANGKIVKVGTPEEIFSNEEFLKQNGLEFPKIVQFQKKFEEKIGIQLSRKHMHLDELIQEIALLIEKKGIR
ncbi:MAG: cbiO [Bacillales bacterium]|jgi:energy-coupling factor transport system ATP-binding protein|nr:cbiO [Bacillales bacterium]